MLLRMWRFTMEPPLRAKKHDSQTEEAKQCGRSEQKIARVQTRENCLCVVHSEQQRNVVYGELTNALLKFLAFGPRGFVLLSEPPQTDQLQKKQS